MSPRLARLLVRCYPASWRQRFGDEFAALLEDHPLTIGAVVDSVAGAARIHVFGTATPRPRPNALSANVWVSWMFAATAGLILYGTADDSALVTAMRSTPALARAWTGIEIGTLAAAAAVILAGLPALVSMVGEAMSKGRLDVLGRLCVPLVSLAPVVLWMAGVSAWFGGHWAAWPWAVGGTRADWPAESVRLATGSVTALLIASGVVAAALGVTQALARSSMHAMRIGVANTVFELDPVRIARRLAPLAVAGVTTMFVSVTLWGVVARGAAGGALEAHTGPLGITTSRAWLLSVALLCVAVGTAARATWSTPAIADTLD